MAYISLVYQLKANGTRANVKFISLRHHTHLHMKPHSVDTHVTFTFPTILQNSNRYFNSLPYMLECNLIALAPVEKQVAVSLWPMTRILFCWEVYEFPVMMRFPLQLSNPVQLGFPGWGIVVGVSDHILSI